MKPVNNKSPLYLWLSILSLFFLFLVFEKNYESIKWLFTSSDNYLSTTGTITQSRIGHTGLRGGWRFYISYEFTVDEALYKSDRVHYGFQTLSDKSYALSYIEKYPIGKSVVVFYDPYAPYKAVLEPSVKWFGILYYATGLLLLSCIFIYLYVVNLKK